MEIVREELLGSSLETYRLRDDFVEEAGRVALPPGARAGGPADAEGRLILLSGHRAAACVAGLNIYTWATRPTGASGSPVVSHPRLLCRLPADQSPGADCSAATRSPGRGASRHAEGVEDSAAALDARQSSATRNEQAAAATPLGLNAGAPEEVAKTATSSDQQIPRGVQSERPTTAAVSLGRNAGLIDEEAKIAIPNQQITSGVHAERSEHAAADTSLDRNAGGTEEVARTAASSDQQMSGVRAERSAQAAAATSLDRNAGGAGVVATTETSSDRQATRIQAGRSELDASRGPATITPVEDDPRMLIACTSAGAAYAVLVPLAPETEGLGTVLPLPGTPPAGSGSTPRRCSVLAARRSGNVVTVALGTRQAHVAEPSEEENPAAKKRRVAAPAGSAMVAFAFRVDGLDTVATPDAKGATFDCGIPEGRNVTAPDENGTTPFDFDPPAADAAGPNRGHSISCGVAADVVVAAGCLSLDSSLPVRAAVIRYASHASEVGDVYTLAPTEAVQDAAEEDSSRMDLDDDELPAARRKQRLPAAAAAVVPNREPALQLRRHSWHAAVGVWQPLGVVETGSLAPVDYNRASGVFAMGFDVDFALCVLRDVAGKPSRGNTAGGPPPKSDASKDPGMRLLHNTRPKMVATVFSLPLWRYTFLVEPEQFSVYARATELSAVGNVATVALPAPIHGLVAVESDEASGGPYGCTVYTLTADGVLHCHMVRHPTDPRGVALNSAGSSEAYRRITAVLSSGGECGVQRHDDVGNVATVTLPAIHGLVAAESDEASGGPYGCTDWEGGKKEGKEEEAHVQRQVLQACSTAGTYPTRPTE
eukprot:gene8121-12492_t